MTAILLNDGEIGASSSEKGSRLFNEGRRTQKKGPAAKNQFAST